MRLEYMIKMGFELKNPRNWTYATPDIYLSDMHDENVIRSNKSDTSNFMIYGWTDVLTAVNRANVNVSSDRYRWHDSILKSSTTDLGA